jgi:hypothetical protein
VIQKDISLRDALCGVSFTVKHLDGRLLHITSPAGEVVRPNSFQVVHDEGMPFPGRPYVKGHLYVNFQVGGAGRTGAGRVRRTLRVCVGGLPRRGRRWERRNTPRGWNCEPSQRRPL